MTTNLLGSEGKIFLRVYPKNQEEVWRGLGNNLLRWKAVSVRLIICPHCTQFLVLFLPSLRVVTKCRGPLLPVLTR